MKNLVTVFVYTFALLFVALVLDGCEEAKKSETPQDSISHDILEEEIYQGDAIEATDAPDVLEADVEIAEEDSLDAEQ